ncbi:YbaB/EbfC family nucleoid-associated protein [Mycolicibacterium smegmatis]|uniref:YbaB/EbfC family nucleoid-associated protein n=1 Tax=Mycolicibacterium smegmatis TaxID=1772 RepID=UPI0013031F00|nr:YbaB/EbfC family nucleoid-associated protein [Mycolicibacterium smegmatis]
MLAQRDLLHALNEHTKAISVRVTSPDRTVSVEVDAYGAMTDLWLSENAYRHGATPLAGLIVKTARAAAEVAEQRQRFLNSQFHRRAAIFGTAE